MARSAAVDYSYCRSTSAASAGYRSTGTPALRHLVVCFEFISGVFSTEYLELFDASIANLLHSKLDAILAFVASLKFLFCEAFFFFCQRRRRARSLRADLLSVLWGALRCLFGAHLDGFVRKRSSCSGRKYNRYGAEQ